MFLEDDGGCWVSPPDLNPKHSNEYQIKLKLRYEYLNSLKKHLILIVKNLYNDDNLKCDKKFINYFEKQIILIDKRLKKLKEGIILNIPVRFKLKEV